MQALKEGKRVSGDRMAAGWILGTVWSGWKERGRIFLENLADWDAGLWFSSWSEQKAQSQ